MDITSAPLSGDATGYSSIVRRGSTQKTNARHAAQDLRCQIGDAPLALLVVFLAPEFRSETMARWLEAAFPDTIIVGCTTAGEITPEGLGDNNIVAVGFPTSHFVAASGVIHETPPEGTPSVPDTVLDLLAQVATEQPNWKHQFAFLFGDGLARNEDLIVSQIHPALGATRLFGGSAGDTLDFRETFVLWQGRFHSRLSILNVIRTRCRAEVFRFDHFAPSDIRLVVTAADPEQRLVTEINAEPAAREYARIIGKDPGQLTPFVFASNPMLVRAGGEYHVRAIQRVEDDGALRFFSAIDVGLVLTVANAENILTHTRRKFQELSADGKPDVVIGCECVLRKLEVEATQVKGPMSELMRENNVVGFNTFGEQYQMLHVNQTFTGVAIFAEDEAE